MLNGDPFDQLDPLLQHKLRLGACVMLSREDALSFAHLKTALGATDGNLGAQLTKLETNGYLTVTKEFVDRKPVSWYALSESGKKALNTHLDALQAVIDVRNGN